MIKEDGILPFLFSHLAIVNKWGIVIHENFYHSF